ncbi:MAG: hypothetical protein AB7F59_06785 [Bdellovibrionales bacterium]
MKSFLLIFSFLCGLLCSVSADAQNVIDVNETVTVNQQSEIPSREELHKSTAMKVSEQYVKEMLGDIKYERNRRAIYNRILAQYARFIPLMRNTPFENVNGKLQSVVSMKLSLKDLRQVLLKENLLSSTEGIPSLAPFILLLDRVNARSYRWWVNDANSSSLLQEYHQRLVSELKVEFGKRGFYVVDPAARNLKDLIPPAYLSDSYRTADLVFLGDLLKYQILLSGRLIFSQLPNQTNTFRVMADIQAVQATNGQVIAEINRPFDIKGTKLEWALQSHFTIVLNEITKELTGQLQEVWQKGTLGSDYLKLVLKGDLDYQELETVKTEISKIPEVKLLRERYFSRGEVTFDLNATTTTAQLSEKIRALKGLHQYQVSASSTELQMRKK